ncbi:DUF2513 domain-containing protein [Oenococcus oeni]|nr:DUF2513 domain-containing protein [Oenococcus oeni]
MKDITLIGHEFIDSITDEANWHKAKEKLPQLRGSFDLKRNSKKTL